MPMRCKVCSHPEREKLDIALAQGVAMEPLARRYDLPPSSVRRHRNNGHIPAEIIDAFPRRADLSEEALVQLRRDESAGILLGLARQRRILLDVQDRAAAKKNNEWILKVANALHRNIELVARAVGEFAQHERAIQTTNVLGLMMAPDYIRLRSRLLEAVRPFPQARAAVAQALAEVEGEAAHLDGYAMKQIEAVADG
jgi:DNA-binding transcriptional ArsR family regulator